MRRSSDIERQRARWLRLPVLALLAAALLLGAGCGGDDEESAATGTGAESAAQTVDSSGELGPPEDTEVTVAIPFPDTTMYSLYLIGQDLGYYEEEGLSVEVITADDPVAAVAGESADVGVVETGGAIEAIRNDLGVTILSGHFCRQNYSFAVQPDIQSVEQLEGTDIVLAGTPGDQQQFQRKQVLASEGWDVDTVDVDVVYPGPDSATWREFFVSDRVSLMPFYDDDRKALEEYGANIIIDTVRPWPNSVQLVREQWLQENPNTAVRFLRATMKAVEFLTAPGVGELPENKDKVLDILEAHDLDIGNKRQLESPWVLSGMNFCPGMYFGEEAWEVTMESANLEPLEFDVDLSYLTRAQELLGLSNEPPKNIQDIYP